LRRRLIRLLLLIRRRLLRTRLQHRPLLLLLWRLVRLRRCHHGLLGIVRLRLLR